MLELLSAWKLYSCIECVYLDKGQRLSGLWQRRSPCCRATGEESVTERYVIW